MACVGTVLFSSLLDSCASVVPIPVSLENNRIKVPLSAFQTVQEEQVKWKRSVVLRHASLAFPIAVFRNKDGAYNAVLMQCTHQTNELNLFGDLLACNAHGSEFSTTGQVLQGPAEQPLRTYQTRVDNDHLFILLA